MSDMCPDNFAHESGERMPPDIFTKMFADKDKWITARQLINIVLPTELKKVISDAKAIYEGIQQKPALGASALPSAGGGISTPTAPGRHMMAPGGTVEVPGAIQLTFPKWTS